jgi:peptidyl-tRNA hydrolase, PTH1 family
MKILVGLGNPGEKYELNRHNAGFMAVDAIARRYGAVPWRRRFQGSTTEVEAGGEKCLLLKPATYMNESGRAVGEAMRFFKLSQADVIVFHDELDLEPGKIRVKTGGGQAGHNGLRSISAHIGNDYTRVRIGIGHPGSRDVVVHYVLHDFSRDERDALEPVLSAIADSVPFLVAGQEARFMNEIARICRPAPAKTDKDSAPAPKAKAKEAATATRASESTPVSSPAATENNETSLGAKLRSWLNRR